MERMNDILARTAQRRQKITDQRSLESNTSYPEAPASQGPRPAQPLARRQMPEQMARLGQQNTLPSRLPNQQNLPSRSRPVQREVPQQRTGGQPQPPQYGRQLRSPISKPAELPAYQPRRQPTQNPHYQIQETAYEPAWTPVANPDLYTGNRQSIPAGQADAYPNMLQADVIEEWEEDTGAMRYGDWENHESDASQYSRPLSSRPSPSRELPAIQETTIRDASQTRNLRDPRMSQAHIPVPMPQALAQEPRPHHRITQPLNPQSISAISPQMVQEAPRTGKPVQREAVSGPVQPYTTGSFPAPLAQKAVCPFCKGAGYLRANVAFGHPNFGKPIACECKEAERKEKRRQQLRDLSNLGAFNNASFRNFNANVSPIVKRAYQVAQEYAANPYGWLLLIGRNGCGKTHLAAAIANQYLDEGSLVLFSVVPELLAHLRATFAPTSNVVYDQLFSNMREAELLVLDDLGAQQSSPWANEKLFQLLNYRYNERFPTIITTNNIGLQGVEDRIRSRLTDASLVTTITFEGAADYRPRNPRRD